MKLFFSILAVVTVACAVPLNKLYTSENGSKYFIEGEYKYTWFEALHECAQKNMSLLDINSAYDNQQIDFLIKTVFDTNPSLWLAGHESGKNTRYVWANTGATMAFTNWALGEPTRSDYEYCVCILKNTWQWHDAPCDYKLGFICKEKPQVVQTATSCSSSGKTYNIVFNMYSNDANVK